MHFRYPQKVLFRHCDPAGIVFYPRFFEMINDAVEAMFADLLDWPFETMHPGHGVPTAAFDVQFKAPCRHGDHLVLEVAVQAIGGSSLTLLTRAMGGETLRFEARQVLVCVGPDGSPTRWPGAIRDKINKLREGLP